MTQSDQCVKLVIVSSTIQNLKTQEKVFLSSKQGIVEEIFECPVTKKVLLAKKMLNTDIKSIESEISDYGPVENAFVSIQINPIQVEPFRDCSRMEGGKKAPLPKICHTYPTMMKLDTVIPHLKKIHKIFK